MPGFKYASHDELQPALPALPNDLHEIPLYVVAFKEPLTANPAIITQPGRRLMLGKRIVARSIERDANEIARSHQIISSAHTRLALPFNKEDPYTQGYSVRPADRTPLPNIADFTRQGYAEDHSLPLEVHAYSDLVEQLADMPGRELELAYLRKFGEQALSNYR